MVLGHDSMGRKEQTGRWNRMRSGADGEPPHMKLVDALSGSVRKGSGVCVSENSGDCQVLGSRVASAN